MANLGTLVAVSFLLAAYGTMARRTWVERISDLAFVTFYVSPGRWFGRFTNSSSIECL